jgi:hypothetical protein
MRVSMTITSAKLGKAEQHPLILPTDFVHALARKFAWIFCFLRKA